MNCNCKKWLYKFVIFLIVIILVFSSCFYISKTYFNQYANIENLAKLNDPNKWLIYECKNHCGGWADRLKGIMSVYALSLMTNRHFLIDITTPCNFSKLFVPNLVDWSMPSSNSNRITHMNCMNQLEIGPECLSKFEISELNTEGEEEEAPNMLALTSNQEWLSFFARKKGFESQILALGHKTIEDFQLPLVFHQWYKKLFKLSPVLNEKYELIKSQARLQDETMRVYCAQIRIGGSRPNVPFDARFNEMGVQKLFWKFIRNEFIQKEKDKYSDWRLFITSDIESVELEAVKEFGHEQVIRISGINSHIDRESNLSNDCTRIEKPILDFHFLQNCHKAVISQQSGFGQLGLWNRKNPNEGVFVFKNNHFYSIDEFYNNSNHAWICAIIVAILVKFLILYFKAHKFVYYKLKQILYRIII